MHASCCLPAEMETNPHTSFLESYQRCIFRTHFPKLACKFSQQRRKHPTSGMRVLILTQHRFLRTGQSLSTLSPAQPPALEVKAPSVPAQYHSPFGTDPLCLRTQFYNKTTSSNTKKCLKTSMLKLLVLLPLSLTVRQPQHCITFLCILTRNYHCNHTTGELLSPQHKAPGSSSFPSCHLFLSVCFNSAGPRQQPGSHPPAHTSLISL